MVDTETVLVHGPRCSKWRGAWTPEDWQAVALIEEPEPGMDEQYRQYRCPLCEEIVYWRWDTSG